MMSSDWYSDACGASKCGELQCHSCVLTNQGNGQSSIRMMPTGVPMISSAHTHSCKSRQVWRIALLLYPLLSPVHSLHRSAVTSSCYLAHIRSLCARKIRLHQADVSSGSSSMATPTPQGKGRFTGPGGHDPGL